MKTIRNVSRWIFFGLSVLLSPFLFFLSRWTFSTWPNLQLDELIFQLKASAQGTSSDLLQDGLMDVLVPSALIVVTALLAIIWLCRYRVRWLPRFLNITTILCTFVLAFTIHLVWTRLDIGRFISAQFGSSDFIKAHYVNPDEVNIRFPEDKKNIIYIYLESAEVTFADESSGGAFEQNVIPELTALAQQNEDFSGASSMLNGAHVLQGASWTMGAMFAHTSGLPLQIAIDGNAMDTQNRFFPNLTTFGDILAEAGYNQSLLIGSDAAFGGRSLYFEEHGGYNILDYNHAILSGLIPSDYYVWWGYEDAKLFEYAKQELTSLSEKEEPFNLTILTVDTHFEDGYVCSQCPTAYADDQYSNVFSCSSKTVDNFVQWIQQQDFYEDTVIVLVGDHLTMDADYCADVDSGYTRKAYTAFINAQKDFESEQFRNYSTFDLFPTTLSAMGVTFEGNRLGLGVNLYSSEETLVEKYGVSDLNNELYQKSPFMEELAQITFPGDAALKIEPSEDGKSAQFKVYDITGVDGDIKSVEIEIWGDDGQKQRKTMKMQPDRSYVAEVDISSLDSRYGNVLIYAVNGNKERYALVSIAGDVTLYGENDIDTYLDRLAALENHTIFISAADEASSALPQTAMDKLRAMGVTSDLKPAFRHSFYAIIEPGKQVKEALSIDSLATDGMLPDGTAYVVTSAGYDTGKSGSKIYIGNADYSLNKRGLNFAVYDNNKRQVVNTATFDTHLGSLSAHIGVEPVQDRKDEYVISVSSIRSTPYAHIVVRYWDSDSPNKVEELQLQPGEGGIYSNTARISKLDRKEYYFVAYAVSENGEQTRLCELLKSK